MSLRAKGEAILSFSLLRRSAPRNDFYASGEGGGYLVKGLKGAKNRGPHKNIVFVG